MAHDFLGTFNRTQFQRFLAFARSQLPTVEPRIMHLKAELARIGELEFVFDTDNRPVRVTATEGSYLGKLLAAYEVLGGNPFLDLRVRTRNQAIFLRPGSEVADSYQRSDGEPLSAKGLLDGLSAELVRRLRSPFQEALSYRFESLERKIRRALDYTDELKKEISQLTVLQRAGTTEGSLEYIANQIEQLFSDRGYRAIYDDGGADPLGINSYAPFSQYDVEPHTDANLPQRDVVRPQRQGSGYVGPGRGR